MSIDDYPIIDFSDIPGCESPISLRSSVSSSVTSTRVTKSTKSRISSIFSSTLDSVGDDDTFDLKASARKMKPLIRPIRESFVNTARLIDIGNHDFGYDGDDNMSGKKTLLLLPIRETFVNTARLIDIDNHDSPGMGGLTDWNKMKFEASVIASEIKDDEEIVNLDEIEEKFVNLDEILNQSPLVNASPLSSFCTNDGLGEVLLLETSPEISPLKFRFDDHSEPRKKLWNKENKLLEKPSEPIKEVFIDDQLEKAIERKPLTNLNQRQIQMKTPTKTSTSMKPPESKLKSAMTPRLAMTSSKPAMNSSKLAMTPSKPAMTPSRLAMTPPRFARTSSKPASTSLKSAMNSSKLAMTPSKHAMTPSKPSMTPSRLPMTPSRLPMTPSRLLMTPSKVSLSNRTPLITSKVSLSNRTPLIPSKLPGTPSQKLPIKPSLNMVTPVSNQKLTLKSNTNSQRRSISLNKPMGVISSQPNMKTSLNLRRSAMTPTPGVSSKRKPITSQSSVLTSSSTPKIGPVLARPLLSSSSNGKNTNLVLKRRSIQASTAVKSVQR